MFNANPLLRFDGYYILSDLVEMPNLAQRGNQYWRYLAERYLLRVRQAEPPVLTPGERNWLRIWTPLAFVYRVTVLVAIVVYVASEWFFIGVALAIWGVVTMAGVQEMRARATGGNAAVLVGRTTSAFALGQIAGPIVSSLLLHVPGFAAFGLDRALQAAAIADFARRGARFLVAVAVAVGLLRVELGLPVIRQDALRALLVVRSLRHDSS